nr:MauE/DoxX family redox-associated membrane protein [Angustibacter aerolatus]
MHVPTWRAWLATALRLVVAAVLAVAGALKPARSRRVGARRPRLPAAARGGGAGGRPRAAGARFVVAVLLVLGLATRYAAGVAGLLMLAFVIGISSVWARGISIDCGCFGGGGAVAAGQTHYLPEPGARRRPAARVGVPGRLADQPPLARHLAVPHHAPRGASHDVRTQRARRARREGRGRPRRRGTGRATSPARHRGRGGGRRGGRGARRHAAGAAQPGLGDADADRRAAGRGPAQHQRRRERRRHHRQGDGTGDRDALRGLPVPGLQGVRDHDRPDAAAGSSTPAP